ncbi:aminotransferase class IV [Pseudomonas nicosulfuronedens]
MRVYDGIPFKLDEHLKRLYKSASVMGLTVAHSIDELKEATFNLIKLNGLDECYIKPLVYLDDSDISFMGRGCRSHVALLASEMKSNSELRGVSLEIPAWRRPSSKCHPYNAKTSSTYALSYLAYRARSPGVDDVLFLNEGSLVCESSGSNVVFIRGSELVTPRADNCLAGITRATILYELAPALNLKSTVRDIHVDELPLFDGALLCGTAVEVAQVNKIDSVIYPGNSIVESIFQSYRGLTIAGH